MKHRPPIELLVLLCGISLVSAGAAVIYPPAGLIALGLAAVIIVVR